MIKPMQVVCFGEILLDIFPNHTKIGGAPLNVSQRLQHYGVNVSIISSVGKDSNGNKLINYLNESGVNTNCIQIENSHATGQVNVSLDSEGIATYEISYPVAWDKITTTPDNQVLVANSDVFVFGSLVCRDKVSRQSLLELISYSKYNVFDVNLRSPHYTNEVLLELMRSANFIKFNDEELFYVADLLGCKFHSMEQIIAFIAKETSTDTICVTKGAYGALLYLDKHFYHNSGYRVKVKDTVGSGDSFLASLLFQLFKGKGPQESLNFACAVGAMVAASEGANPVFTRDEIKQFMNI